MLNTEKLLYILPDLTYLAELLPGKKEHVHTIQSFRQINGEFLDDNEFISNNIQKLFTKIDKEEYHLILPDFLFTNTIVGVDDDSKTGAIAHVKEKLLPNLDLSDKTHEIEVTVLTSFKGKSKVQISAIEKELLAPIRVAAKKSKVTIKAVSPLSWAIKSIVSLEPSITVLQIGNNLYSSQHYIGIDQTNNFPVENLKSIVETIKTLKGAEPSIQTIYLASSTLVEEKLKEELSGTLPIQQLAVYKEEDSKMPSYVKYIIESCMKTLSISDFPVPKFDPGKATKDEESKAVSPETTESDDKKTKKDEVESSSKEKTNSKDPAPTDLPAPSKVPGVAVLAEAEEISTMPNDKKSKDEEVKEEVKVEKTEEEAEDKKETKTVTIEAPPEEDTEEIKKPVEEDKDEKSSEKEEAEEEVKEKDKKEDVEKKEEKKDEPDEEDEEDDEDSKEEDSGLAAFSGKPEASSKNSESSKDEDEKEEGGEINLTQFSGKEEDSKKDDDVESKKNSDDKEEDKVVGNLKKKPQKVIKNSSGVSNMLKMVFITLAVFFITIAIGIGVGLGLLKMSDKNKTEEPAPVVMTDEEPEETPEASESAVMEEKEIDKEALSIFVVNATTKAGYAGKIKALLIEDEIADVTAGNAEGDYEEGTDYILMTEENEALETLLEEASSLDLEYGAEVDVEDPDGDYDAIIVLAK